MFSKQYRLPITSTLLLMSAVKEATVANLPTMIGPRRERRTYDYYYSYNQAPTEGRRKIDR